jgi:prolyl 4-hydroxylase
MKILHPLSEQKRRAPFVASASGAVPDALCDELIARIDAENPKVAPIIVRGVEIVEPGVRNNERVLFDDAPLAQKLFERTREIVPERLNDGTLVGYNERFRGYRYRRGMRFAPHFDGAYFRPGSKPREGSQVTLLFYLNSDFAGGETELIDYEVVIQPKKGGVLAFEHAMYHQGCTVTSGTKYVLRTDAMYRF